jgi:branched-chain amino acid transport system permease protein
MISVTVIAMALLGGGDDARGPLLGVLFLALLSELLWAHAPLLYMVVLGVILVVFVLLVPDGLVGLMRRRRKAKPA